MIFSYSNLLNILGIILLIKIAKNLNNLFSKAAILYK